MQKCKELVGFSNEKELAFARYLNEHNIPVWIRQVIVPGITDDENDLLDLKTFLNSFIKSCIMFDLRLIYSIYLPLVYNIFIYNQEKKIKKLKTFFTF